MMKIDEVSKKIRQRPPFQMIEKVVEIEPNQSAYGIKNVSINEPYFMGHFPDLPIMPGVLIVECCAQLCSVVFDSDGVDESQVSVLLKVDTFKFLKPVIPGDTLHIYVNKTKIIGPLTVFDCVVKVDGLTRAKGTLTFAAIPKESVYK